SRHYATITVTSYSENDSLSLHDALPILKDSLPDPPHGIRDELEAAGLIEPLCGLDEAVVAFVDQVGKRETLSLILLCDGDDETEVCSSELVERLLVALLYASRQVYFFIWREERNLADLLEILIQHPLLARDIHRPISFLGGSSGSARGYPGLFDEVRHSHPYDGMGSGERFSLGQDRYETPAAIHVFRMVMFRRLRMRAGENSSPGRREAARISTRPQKDLTRLGCRAATHYGQNVICDGAFLAQTGDFRLAANPAFRLDEPPVEGALGQ